MIAPTSGEGASAKPTGSAVGRIDSVSSSSAGPNSRSRSRSVAGTPPIALPGFRSSRARITHSKGVDASSLKPCYQETIKSSSAWCASANGIPLCRPLTRIVCRTEEAILFRVIVELADYPPRYLPAAPLSPHASPQARTLIWEKSRRCVRCLMPLSASYLR